MATTIIVLVPGETSWARDLICEFGSGVSEYWSYQESEKLTRFQDAIKHEKKRRLAREPHRLFIIDAEALDAEKTRSCGVDHRLAWQLREVRHLPYEKWPDKYKQISSKKYPFESFFVDLKELSQIPQRLPAVPEMLVVDHANDSQRIQIILKAVLDLKWKIEIFNVKIEDDRVTFN